MLRFSRNTTPEDLPDEALLAQYLQAGRVQSLGKLYERYMPMVYGVCLKILRDPARSEDAVMAIYEEVVRKLKTNEVETFRGWLYVLARNYCLMEWRKAQRKPTDYHAPEDMSRYDAVEAAFEYELPQKGIPLQECMEGLNKLQQQCVQWFYYEDKSYKDIADLLQDEIGKVRSYIQNGKRNLKNCIEAQS
jgi:RNA polymerase sigma factor (sigma-70 family)